VLKNTNSIFIILEIEDGSEPLLYNPFMPIQSVINNNK